MGGQQEALAALMGGMGGMGMGNNSRMGGKRGMGAMPGPADAAGGDLQGLPDEIMALLGQIQQQGGDLNNLPAEIVASLQQMQQGQAPQPVDDASAEEITPEPGFVVKTQDVGGRKVFINMVGHPRVAAPGDWSGGMLPESVQLALENADNLTEAEANTLRFPLSMSLPKQELDKKGEPATTYDCCLNADVIKMCSAHRPLKVFIIELAINWINHKHKQELDPKYKLPKMRYKGDVVESHRIRVDKKPLVTQVKDIPDEPVFPLLTKKPPAPRTSAVVSSPAGIPAGHPAPSVSTDGGFSALQPTAGGVQGGTPSGFSFARGGGQCFRQLGPPQLEGKPVEFITVEVEVPDRLATQLRGSEVQSAAGESARNGGADSSVLDSLRVELAGQRVWVSAPGCQELEVPLPLAVSQQGAAVHLDVSRQPFPVLTLRLPYMSVTQLAAAAAAHAPHEPGSLNLSSTTALELD